MKFGGKHMSIPDKASLMEDGTATIMFAFSHVGQEYQCILCFVQCSEVAQQET